MIQRFFNTLFDFEHKETAGDVIFFRLFELCVIYYTLYLSWSWGFYIPKIGDVVLPLGIARYIDISFMFDNNLAIVNATVITIASVLAFFRRWRYGYLLVVLGLHLQYVARYSLGEISHGSNVIGVVLIGMTIGFIAFKEGRLQRRFILGHCYFFIGLGYVMAGISKIVATGITWPGGAYLWMWIAERTVDMFATTGQINHNIFQNLVSNTWLIATLGLAFGIAGELLAWLMWNKKYRPLIMTWLIMFHVGVLVVMKINFPSNLAVLVFLGYPWAAFIDWFMTRYDRVLTRYLPRASGVRSG